MITIDPDEKIYLTMRRHRYILLKSLIPEALIFLAVIIFMILALFIRLPAWPDWLTDFLPAFFFHKVALYSVIFT